MKTVFLSGLLTAGLLLPFYLSAQKKADKQLSNRVLAFSPEEQLKGFHLAPGFTIELVASEKDGVIKPIDLAFDDAGNLWTQTAVMYPLDPISDIQWNDLLELMGSKDRQDRHPAFKRVSDLYKGISKGDDKILRLSGIYGGKREVSTWAEGLAIPMSILPYRNGAFVAQGSEIFLLRDENNDGKADRRIPLFTGFGFTDSHTMAHLLRKGPGGWIHFSHGALNKGVVTSYFDNSVKTSFDYSKIGRFSKDAGKMEVITAGLNNIWGYTLRANGQWYGSEANDLGLSVVPLEVGAAFPGIGNEKFRTYQPFYPPVHDFRVGGTGLSGLAFSEDETGGFPEHWKNVGFLANPITNSINGVRIVQKDDGTIVSEKVADLLLSDDDWFRPVNISFGPDGCLYIADWYNKIVSHNEVPTSHPDRDKKHGRIWRIRHESQPVREIIDFYSVPVAELPGYLKSPYLWERRSAWNQISEREPAETKALIPALTALVRDQNLTASVRVHALWSLEALDFFDRGEVKKWISDPESDVRREALRYLTSFPDQIRNFMHEFVGMTDDENANVRFELIRTLGSMPALTTGAIELLLVLSKPELAGDQAGGPYERKFERYLARRVLEKAPDLLSAVLKTPYVEKVSAENLLWAIQVLPVTDRVPYFFRFSPGLQAPDLTDRTFVDLARMASEPRVQALLSVSLNHPTHRNRYLDLILKNQTLVGTDEFKNLLTEPVTEALAGGNTEEERRALEIVTRFNLAVPSGVMAELVKPGKEESILGLIIKALDVVRTEDSSPYRKIADNKSLSLNTRINALQGLIRTEKPLGKTRAEDWLMVLDNVGRRLLTDVLSRFAHSSDFLLELYAAGKLKISDFEVMTADRIHSLASDKSAALSLLSSRQKEEEEHKKLILTRIKTLVPLADRKDGVPAKGQVLFQTCLNCHQAGGKGQQIAPSLDGLGYRDTEGLLHAVLDPDAAIEAGYALFRVVKKDDSALDGYLLKRDATGTTLAFMGGAQLFIAASDIKNQYHVTGKSFMPAGLFDNLSEKDIADILSYIKTIK